MFDHGACTQAAMTPRTWIKVSTTTFLFPGLAQKRHCLWKPGEMLRLDRPSSHYLLLCRPSFCKPTLSMMIGMTCLVTAARRLLPVQLLATFAPVLAHPWRPRCRPPSLMALSTVMGQTMWTWALAPFKGLASYGLAES